jgi:hypothetical protein
MKSLWNSHDLTVVTSSYVTMDRLPILYVSHDYDEEDGDLWQFHCGNGDYSANKLQLVRLDTIVALDATVQATADLPVGFCAKRSAIGMPWVYGPDVG